MKFKRTANGLRCACGVVVHPSAWDVHAAAHAMAVRCARHDWKRYADGRMVCRRCDIFVEGDWAAEAYRASVRERFNAERAARDQAPGRGLDGRADGQANLAGQRYTRRQGTLQDERCVDCGGAIPGVRAPDELTGSLVCAACAKAQGLPTWAELFGGSGA